MHSTFLIALLAIAGTSILPSVAVPTPGNTLQHFETREPVFNATLPTIHEEPEPAGRRPRMGRKVRRSLDDMLDELSARELADELFTREPVFNATLPTIHEEPEPAGRRPRMGRKARRSLDDMLDELSARELADDELFTREPVFNATLATIHEEPEPAGRRPRMGRKARRSLDDMLDELLSRELTDDELFTREPVFNATLPTIHEEPEPAGRRPRMGRKARRSLDDMLDELSARELADAELFTREPVFNATLPPIPEEDEPNQGNGRRGGRKPKQSRK